MSTTLTLKPWTMAALQDANQQRVVQSGAVTQSGARECRPVATGALVPANTFQGGTGPVGYAGEPQQQLQAQFGPFSPDGLPTQPALQGQAVWPQPQVVGNPGQLGVPQQVPVFLGGPARFAGGPVPALVDGSCYHPTPPNGTPAVCPPMALAPPAADVGAAWRPSQTQGAGSAAEARAQMSSLFGGG